MKIKSFSNKTDNVSNYAFDAFHNDLNVKLIKLKWYALDGIRVSILSNIHTDKRSPFVSIFTDENELCRSFGS